MITETNMMAKMQNNHIKIAHCVACLHVHAQEHTYQGSKVTVRLRLVRDGAAADGSPSPGDVCVRIALANCLLMILFTDHHPPT